MVHAREDSERRADPVGLVAPLFAQLVELFAGRVAARVIDHLRATDMPGYVDQATSPLGRRRHIAAIRSGALRGVRIGRRYVAREEDVACYVAQAEVATRPRNSAPPDRVDDLARELDLTGTGGAGPTRWP